MQLKAVLGHPADNPANITSGTAKAADRRRTERRALRLSAAANSHSADGLPVFVLDISRGGLLLEAEPGALAVDERVDISLPDQEVVTGRIAWQSDRFFGCEFTTTISPAAVDAALLKGEPFSTG
ncbi:PilZ domain-containing protein [Altererythrobacter sp. SALINAS58]|uniref:PilZ domain-containing protein n=1 Tax=Alteripontixanthobacter muriae TaxID=2705546 RepID=UPI0015774005|nr:PilZ domain-containing protein [Alteripontixanthobacter muriae]NTZ43977.1 PilZ domain-containing protein [Alteripontixanthobacter muriae]